MAISRNLLGKCRNKTKNIAKTLPLRPCRPSHYTLRRWELPWSVRAAPAAARVSQPFHSDLHSIGTQDDLKAIGCKDFAKELTAIAVFLVKQHSKSCNDPFESLKSILLNLLYSLYFGGCPAEAKPEANGKYSLAPYLTGHWKCQKFDEFEEFQFCVAFFLGANDGVLRLPRPRSWSQQLVTYSKFIFISFM